MSQEKKSKTPPSSSSRKKDQPKTSPSLSAQDVVIIGSHQKAQEVQRIHDKREFFDIQSLAQKNEQTEETDAQLKEQFENSMKNAPIAKESTEFDFQSKAFIEISKKIAQQIPISDRGWSEKEKQWEVEDQQSHLIFHKTFFWVEQCLHKMWKMVGVGP